MSILHTIPTKYSQRDAIHMAIVPLIAGDDLYGGQFFRLKYKTNNVALRAQNENDGLGIVNPFEKRSWLREGDSFWGILTPESITEMRHHWYHPAFDDTQSEGMNPHEEWIRNFACDWNFNYDDLIREASIQDETDWRFITANGIDLHSKGELGEDHDKFWYHLEQLTGKKFDDDHRDNFHWSCSC